MADSRNKGQRGEIQIRDLLRKSTNLQWERVPGSGGFNATHGLKGDVYLPPATGRISKFAIEVKWYADENFNSHIFKDKVVSQLEKWWEQAAREGEEMNAQPMLVFKKDKGDWIVALDLIEGTELLAHVIDDITHMTLCKRGYELILLKFTDFLDNVRTEDIVR